MNKIVFYVITVVLNIIYYVCKPAELFAQVLNFKELSTRIKDIPHWLVSSFTDPDPEEIDYDEEYSFSKAA